MSMMKSPFTNGKLKVLMQEMADLTLPECTNTCMMPLSCCDSLYCDITEAYAKQVYDITLSPTDHPKLKFMGTNGCTVEPYLRPMCTLHTCEINSLGFKRNDPEQKWTNEYFELREKVDELMI